MAQTNAAVPSTGQTASSCGRGQSSELAQRLGQSAQEELNLPICVICSTQTSYAGQDLQMNTEDSQYKCPICADPRQYIGINGQKWTSLAKLHASDKHYHNEFSELIPGRLWSFRTQPSFGIGQRAFLMTDSNVDGLILWDCVAYIDDATIAKINDLSGGKGISHMVVSHPHYYSTTAVWAQAFPRMQVWLADVDFYQWHQRTDLIQTRRDTQAREGDPLGSAARRLRLVKEEKSLIPGSSTTSIFLLGGHFPGSLVLLWEDCLFIADTIQVVPSGLYHSKERQRKGVVTFAFLWSYPNQIPLSAAEVRRVCEPLEKVSFDKAFGAFEGFDVWGHAKEKVMTSRDIVVQRLNVN